MTLALLRWPLLGTALVAGTAGAVGEFPSYGFVSFGDTSRVHDIRAYGSEFVIGRPSGAPEGLVARVVRTGQSINSASSIGPSVPSQGAEFGMSVDVGGQLMAVGETREAETSGSTSSGVARVFERSGGTWVELDWLLSTNATPSEYFGTRVAVAGDTIAVSAPGWSNRQGRVYLYRDTGAGWTNIGAVTAFDGSAYDSFGLAIAGAPGHLAVGSPLSELAGIGLNDEGAVYVFQQSAGFWTPTQRIRSPQPAAIAQFGIAVALDGDTLAIGAATENDIGGVPSGAVYVYTLVGGQWSFIQRIDGAIVNQRAFGLDVSLKGDVMCIGALLGVSGGGSDPKHHVFERRDGLWVHTGTLPRTLVNDRRQRCAISDGFIAVAGYNDSLTANGLRLFPASETIFADAFE